MVLACLAACHKDKEMDVKEAVVSNEEMTVSETQARFSWQVDFAGQFQTGVEVSQNENMADLRRVEASKEEDGYQAIVDSLTEGKKYYYRIVVWNKFGSYAKETKDFRTKEKTLYVIKASCLPTEGGLLTGAGQYEEGQYCTLKAICNEGYDFVNWTENGAQVSTQANYTFKVTQNRNLVANFAVQAPNIYTINVSLTPAGAGTVTGEGVYQQDQQCTVTATANEGYTFACWKENGNVVSNSANYSFPVTNNRTLVAHFTALQPNEYNINVSANPSNGGIVTGGGSYNQDQECTVTANANEGYTFTNWTENGNVVSTNASYTFTVNVNRNLVANFEIKSYTVEVTANPSDGGSVSGGGIYNHGQSCMVSAEANSGFSFIYWTENDVVVSTNEDYPFTVIGDRNLVANFAAQIPNNYEIVVSANPSYGGTVTGGGTYQQGQQCIVTATPNDGYIFTNWTENGEIVWEDSNYAFSVDNNRDLVANFELEGTNSYTITVWANPSEGGTVSGGGTYQEGQSCTVVATASYSYTFTNWTENGNVVSTEDDYTFTVTRNRDLEANFTYQVPNAYDISVLAIPSYGGMVSGGGTYNYNQSCTVHALANDGYSFSNWMENGIVVSTNADYNFNVSGNRDLVANFILQTQTPIGAINGLFSVSEMQQVWFSQGNLQYNAAQGSHQCLDGTIQQGTWRFAVNQYDYIGEANNNISQIYNGWIDLFGWATSGWNCGNTYYKPWDDNMCADCYGPFGNNLTGSFANSDWGRYNAISNDGNMSYVWRILTIEEWEYVFNTRHTASDIRYAKAMIRDVRGESVNGVLLLPDNWSSDYYNLSDPNSSDAWYNSNLIDFSSWVDSLQPHGVVFLPAAGYRNGDSTIEVNSDGYYWSSTGYNFNYNYSYAYRLHFFNASSASSMFLSNGRYRGQSVRLVRVAQ